MNINLYAITVTPRSTYPRLCPPHPTHDPRESTTIPGGDVVSFILTYRSLQSESKLKTSYSTLRTQPKLACVVIIVMMRCNDCLRRGNSYELKRGVPI